jgi:hypothetical protein
LRSRPSRVRNTRSVIPWSSKACSRAETHAWLDSSCGLPGSLTLLETIKNPAAFDCGVVDIGVKVGHR